MLLLPMLAVLRWTALVQHNHSHVSLFRRPAVNRLLDLTLGPVTGMPMELYREAHTRTHHLHTGTPQDWTQPTEVRNRMALQDRPLSRRRNLYVFAPRALVLGWGAVRRDQAQRNRLRAEVGVMATLLIVPLLFGAPLRLLAIALLWVVVAVVSADANRKHHDGYLEAEDATEFANDSFSPLHTRLGYNIGYHSAHHRRPNAHWTKLPDLWRKSRDASSPTARLGAGSDASPF